MSNFDLIDFSSISNNTEEEKNNELEYDKLTTETYRMMRIYKFCPITHNPQTEESFKFYYKWDPYTGERLEIDEVGPLYFDPYQLYKYYFKSRYNNLWNRPENNFEGYYGDLVGIGKKMNIKSRGDNTNKYLFRLPIMDCYLTKNHNYSVVTMGPLLTDNEINELDSIIAKKRYNGFTKIMTLKKYYDNATINDIDKNSEEYNNILRDNSNLSEVDINDKYYRLWVDKLVNLNF